jgi:hypothetical protein
MKVSLLAAAMLASTLPAVAAEQDTRVFEMRTYHVAEGKLEDLHARFRNHTLRLFEKHKITSIGYWVPIENSGNQLIFLLAYPNHESRESAWKAFTSDPEWTKAQSESEAKGKLVTKADQLFLSATNYSAEVKPETGRGERVFELRTYTTPSPETLTALHDRFRNHTMELFRKHGMTNLGYFQPTADQPNADRTLVYFLAHQSQDAAKASFDKFRVDPDWNAARKASEEKAGGSLTVPDGVKSLFLKATDYSPTR